MGERRVTFDLEGEEGENIINFDLTQKSTQWVIGTIRRPLENQDDVEVFIEEIFDSPTRLSNAELETSSNTGSLIMMDKDSPAAAANVMDYFDELPTCGEATTTTPRGTGRVAALTAPQMMMHQEEEDISPSRFVGAVACDKATSAIFGDYEIVYWSQPLRPIDDEVDTEPLEKPALPPKKKLPPGAIGYAMLMDTESIPDATVLRKAGGRGCGESPLVTASSPNSAPSSSLTMATSDASTPCSSPVSLSVSPLLLSTSEAPQASKLKRKKQKKNKKKGKCSVQ
jgi:hypothetical protein